LILTFGLKKPPRGGLGVFAGGYTTIKRQFLAREKKGIRQSDFTVAAQLWN
jgi:hypothetical protein